MVIATHEMGFARDVADRSASWTPAVILEEGPPSRCSSTPREERTQRFLAAHHQRGPALTSSKHAVTK